MKEAQYYNKTNGDVLCELCPHGCRLADGEVGICGARRADDGVLYSLNYGQVTSASMDPIEKKPLYHFYPGSPVYSLGTFGCNFKCTFCQNSSISQFRPPSEEMSVEDVEKIVVEKDIRLVSYTYNEPLIWYEFVLECSRVLAKHDVKNTLVTNGYINQDPLKELLPHIDAVNIDLKSFSEEFYRKYPGGSLAPVLETIRTAYGSCHIELTNLVITDLNDDEGTFRELVDFVASIDRQIPLHISRYHPSYKLDSPPTPIDTLLKFREIAVDKLSFVYLGNVDTVVGNDTICPSCGKTLIKREGYSVSGSLVGGKCSCGEGIYGGFT